LRVIKVNRVRKEIMVLNVRVITPKKVVFMGEAEEIILPSSTGQIGVLPSHAPLLTALDIGVMKLKKNNNWSLLILMEGFAEVEKDNIIILCNEAEETTSIDLKTAQQQLDEITLHANTVTNKKEKIEAIIELRKAKARLQAVM